jgi:hypothetical protein
MLEGLGSILECISSVSRVRRKRKTETLQFSYIKVISHPSNLFPFNILLSTCVTLRFRSSPELGIEVTIARLDEHLRNASMIAFLFLCVRPGPKSHDGPVLKFDRGIWDWRRLGILGRRVHIVNWCLEAGRHRATDWTTL